MLYSNPTLKPTSKQKQNLVVPSIEMTGYPSLLSTRHQVALFLVPSVELRLMKHISSVLSTL